MEGRFVFGDEEMKLARRLEAIREELKKPIPEHLVNVKEEKKMAAKKAPKKKVAKKSADDNVVSLADVAKEAKISPQQVRQKLRAAGVEREKGKRWNWPAGSKALAEVRKAVGL